MIARWLRVVDLAVTKISMSVVAKAVDEAKRVTDTSPHLCRSAQELDKAATGIPLFPPIDQWGALPFPLQALTPHSLSRRVRDILGGDLGAHRDLPVTPVKEAEPSRPTPVPVVQRAVYTRDDAQRAWARRRADLNDLAGVDAMLAEVDARATDLQRRTAAILVGQTDRAEPARRGMPDHVPRRHPGHRRPPPGPGPMPLRLAVTLDHPGSAVPTTTGDGHTGPHPPCPPDGPLRPSKGDPHAGGDRLMTLGEIGEETEQIRERSPAGTTAEQQQDLTDLDDLLGELDDLATRPVVDTEAVDEQRGRIEILMDQIETSLGIDPPPITGYADTDL